MTKIINIIPTVSEQSDGVGKFVREYFTALKSCEVTTEIFSLDEKDKNFSPNVRVFKKFKKSGKFEVSLGLLKRVRSECRAKEEIFFHIHGLWMWVNFLPLFVPKLRYIYSPHGSISPETKQNWSSLRSFVFKFFQLPVINRAKIVHATSDLEKKWLIDSGVKSTLISVIPLCDDLGNFSFSNRRQCKRNTKRYLFVGRLVKIKNLPSLITAFDSLTKLDNDASLEIIGKCDTSYGRTLQELTPNSRIKFLGEMSPEDVREKLKCADYLVLPSFSENFSYSALEACLAGCNLVVSSNTPWEDLTPSYVTTTFSPYSTTDILGSLQKCTIRDYRSFCTSDLHKFSRERFVKKIMAGLKK